MEETEIGVFTLVIISAVVSILVTTCIFRKAEKEINEHQEKEYEEIRKGLETQRLLLTILLSRGI